MVEKAKSLKTEINLLFQSVPGYIVALFCVSVVMMNLLANKSVDGLPDWLALDCGFTLSWLSFLCMDTLTKHFGPRASIIISVFALLTNLVIAGVLAIAAIIPGTWSAFFDFNDSNINLALNQTFGGTWYVLLGSSISFLLSAIVNSVTNQAIGKMLKTDSFGAFAARSYISTGIGQFVDNLTFALIVSHTFFGWSLTQCITCAITGMVIELLCEVIFSPLGYKITQAWKRDQVGKAYTDRF